MSPPPPAANGIHGGSGAAGTADGELDGRCGPGGDTEIEIVGATEGGGVDGFGLGLNDSSGSGLVFGLGSGSNGTQPMPVNSTSGQASASRPCTVDTPGRAWNPTITRLGRPSIRASTAKLAANCSEVPFWPPRAGGENRKKFRFGYAWPLGASLTSV